MNDDTAKEIAAHLAGVGRQLRAIKWLIVAAITLYAAMVAWGYFHDTVSVSLVGEHSQRQ